MSMDELVDALLSESKKEAKKITDKAEKEAKVIISEAEEKEKKRLEQAEKEVRKRLESQEKERVAWAHLEKKRILSEAKEEVVNRELENLFLGLSKLRTHSSYPKFLKDKTMDAVKELGTTPLTIRVVKGDKKHLSSLKISKAKITEDLKASGGVLVENNSGTIVVDYTLETVYELKRPLLRKEMYSSIFGG